MIERVTIDTDYIRLDQFLKYIAVAQTGGHAKILIKEGQIKVNNEICFQRGKKLIKNDKIEIDGQGIFQIVDKL
ncbi:MAG: RNA-binding S4 domain-containing protein [Firmicutes bacterium]|nr:RNA-binding S4 domain-containing protein [Bacillota bacterium]